MTANNPGYSRPPELADISVHYRDDDRWVTCFCTKTLHRSIVPHMNRRSREGIPRTGKNRTGSGNYVATRRSVPEVPHTAHEHRGPDHQQEGSAPKHSRTPPKLSRNVDLVDSIFDKITLACAREIERLREAGVVPADAPRLGEKVAIDATDIESYANNKKKPYSDTGATWGFRTPKKGSREHRGKERSDQDGAEGVLLRLQSTRPCRLLLPDYPST